MGACARASGPPSPFQRCRGFLRGTAPPQIQDPGSMHNETTHAHPTAGGHDGYIHDVLAARHAKDEFFERSHQSPLPHEGRHDFAGLVYFAPDATYRLPALRLEPLDASATAPFKIDTSDHRPRTAYRLGRLRFTLAGRELTLTAYRVGEADSDALFVPFRDATSGVETYGPGRYLDIEREADGTYTVDFNE